MHITSFLSILNRWKLCLPVWLFRTKHDLHFKMCELQLYLLQHLYPSSQCEYHASFFEVPSSEYRQSYVTAWLPLRARCTSFCLSGSTSKEIAVKTFSVTEEIMEEEQYKYCISSATPQAFLQGLAADFSLASVTSCRSMCKPNIFVSFSFRSVNCIWTHFRRLLGVTVFHIRKKMVLLSQLYCSEKIMVNKSV